MLPGAQSMRTTLIYTITVITKDSEYRAMAVQADSTGVFMPGVLTPPAVFLAYISGLRLLCNTATNGGLRRDLGREEIRTPDIHGVNVAL